MIQNRKKEDKRHKYKEKTWQEIICSSRKGSIKCGVDAIFEDLTHETFWKKRIISIYGFKKTYAYWHRLNFKRENSYWEICSKTVERGREGERKEY